MRHKSKSNNCKARTGGDENCLAAKTVGCTGCTRRALNRVVDFEARTAARDAATRNAENIIILEGKREIEWSEQVDLQVDLLAISGFNSLGDRSRRGEDRRLSKQLDRSNLKSHASDHPHICLFPSLSLHRYLPRTFDTRLYSINGEAKALC